MSVEKEKISKEEDLISLQEKDVIIDNNDIKIEEATIDQLIDIIKKGFFRKKTIEKCLKVF